VYKRHLTTNDFIQKVNECLSSVDLTCRDIDTVYCDSSEPDRIEEFRRAGFEAIGGTKKFTERIDKVKTVKVHINPFCINTVKEIQSYKFKKDKDGNVEDKPIPRFDHAMDAMGYCVYGELGVKEEVKEQFLAVA